MSKRKKHKPKKNKHGDGSGGGTPPAQPDRAALLAELDERLARIRNADASTRVGPIWGEMHKLLLKMHADADAAARMVMARDLDGLQRLIAPPDEDVSKNETPDGEDDASGEAADDASGDAMSATAGPSIEGPDGIDIPPETLKKALRAFRKRLKLTRLDHESKLGRGAMTSGKKADFDAILPPWEYPDEVWQALCARGDLEHTGGGFYRLRNEQRS